MMMMLKEPITEEWLREVGFRWHQFDRQPDKHWILWLGDSLREKGGWCFTSTEDLGIELAYSQSFDNWFCWLRSDTAGRYHRFIHVRHLKVRGDVIRLIVALVDCDWEPANHINGCLLKPEQAEYRRRELERLDQQLIRNAHPWYEAEKDDSRGRPLLEHVEAAIKSGGAS